MKGLAFLLTALAANTVLAQGVSDDTRGKFTYKVEATFKGKPIPASEIRVTPIDTGRQVVSAGRVAKKDSVSKRANPTAISSNWCGSTNYASTSNRIKLVYSYYQHPTCTKRTGVTTYPQAAAAWVGIDGDTAAGAILQSGTVCKIDNSTGIVRNEAWWQWYPNGAYTISSLPVNAGDWFEVTINTTSSTAGKVTITNVSQGYSYAITVTNGAALARLDADWIVECPWYGSGLAGFAHHSDVWFIDARADLATGTMGILGATQYQITGKCSSAEYSNTEMVAWSP